MKDRRLGGYSVSRSFPVPHLAEISRNGSDARRASGGSQMK